MPRPATGSVVEPKDGRGWALRFWAYGKREFVTLGQTEDGWNRQRAEDELRHILADVERGIWQPHEPAQSEAPPQEPTFHEFASDWLAGKRLEVKPKTVKDYEWALSYHLLPYFKDYRLSEITIEEVDRYKAAKLDEGILAADSINKTLKRLSQIMEVAAEYGHIPRNPASGRRRRLKEPKKKRTWVEVEQLPSLLDAADSYMRPVIALLAGAGGLRIGEAGRA